MIVKLLSLPIRFYKVWISPLLGPGNCRYHPTCSAYALEALKIHGPVLGLWLGGARILSCHAYSRRPFHDPVPQAITPVSSATETTENK
ncbi:MAG: rane protein insertion efficiency factor YidD [Micavibrio sp.]|nr:rane protein insertion efficiency factor YidD [Micavibrio sp.]